MCLQLICRACERNLQPSRSAYKPCKQRDRSGHVAIGERKCQHLLRRFPSRTESESQLICPDCEANRQNPRERAYQPQQSPPSSQYVPPPPSPTIIVWRASPPTPTVQCVPPPPAPFILRPPPPGRYAHENTGADKDNAEKTRLLEEEDNLELNDLPLGSCERLLLEMRRSIRGPLADFGGVNQDDFSVPLVQGQSQRDSSFQSQGAPSNQLGSFEEPASGYDFSAQDRLG